jgi:hypothetical protein
MNDFHDDEMRPAVSKASAGPNPVPDTCRSVRNPRVRWGHRRVASDVPARSEREDRTPALLCREPPVQPYERSIPQGLLREVAAALSLAGLALKRDVQCRDDLDRRYPDRLHGMFCLGYEIEAGPDGKSSAVNLQTK